jgi:hypothetical protein
MPRGTCKLCLSNTDLQESHLMPRALYRMARGSGSKGNQDPHVLTAKERKPTSHQVKDYVLCWHCEQRFSKNGEQYVMSLITRRDGIFPLLEKLKGISTPLKTQKSVGYSITEAPDIDRKQIAYFALSVFWRASVHTWSQQNGEKIHIDLGRKYNEEIRRYLLGETEIPRNANLLVAACIDETSQKTFFAPQENQKIKDRSFGVMVRGVFFLFRITKTPAAWQSHLSMVNTVHGLISLWDCFERGVWRLGEGQ